MSSRARKRALDNLSTPRLLTSKAMLREVISFRLVSLQGTLRLANYLRCFTVRYFGTYQEAIGPKCMKEKAEVFSMTNLSGSDISTKSYTQL